MPDVGVSLELTILLAPALASSIGRATPSDEMQTIVQKEWLKAKLATNRLFQCAFGAIAERSPVAEAKQGTYHGLRESTTHRP